VSARTAPGRRARRTARGLGGILLLVAALTAIPAAGASDRAAGRDAAGGVRGPLQRPDIVLILTDDQRWDTLWAMPEVQSLLVSRGVTFTHAFVENPLCCPSRASILTGQPSHSTGVWTNLPPNGGFQAFRDGSTIATWLHDAGYRTALVGKYLNRYRRAAHQGYVPPGWDRWVALAENNGRYYDYDLSVNGSIRHFGTSAEDYSTNVYTRYAVDFIRSTRRPLFLYYAPSAPHAPFQPAPRDANAFADLAPYDAPSYGEPDVSDKPAYVRQLDWTRWRSASIQAIRRNQYRTLLAVDRGVGRIVQALEDTGRLSNALIVFMSDNGYLWGEHRLKDKRAPYEESIRVPLVIRDDALFPGGTVDDRLALNIDLAPTFAAVAGAAAPGAAGLSMLRPADSWRARFPIEHYQFADPVPSYCGARTRRWKYVDYRDGTQELYDLGADPYELTNEAAEPGLQPILDRLRAYALAQCTPPPPDWPGG
jgi:N-acetylglucosamine-6-sulfatase